MNRNTFSAFALSLTLAAGAASASTATLPNGQSVYGTAGQGMQATKVVDVNTAKTVNVNCGDLVQFTNGKQSFTWKIEVATHRSVNLQAVAPAGFTDKKLIVYVANNDSEIN